LIRCSCACVIQRSIWTHRWIPRTPNIVIHDFYRNLTQQYIIGKMIIKWISPM
jgi:hypothetical protein